MKIKLIATAFVLGAFFSTANAQTVKEKAQNQHQRIKQGVKSGELTKSETKNLVNGQKEVRQDVKSAKSDGVVTKDERKDIKQEQRQQSRKIFRKKHNSKDRS